MKKRLKIKYPIGTKHVSLAHRLFHLNNEIIDLSKYNSRISFIDTDNNRRSVMKSDIPDDWWEDVPEPNVPEPNESEFYKWVHKNKDFPNHPFVYDVAKSSRNKTLYDVIFSIDEIIITVGTSINLNDHSLLSHLKKLIEELKEK